MRKGKLSIIICGLILSSIFIASFAVAAPTIQIISPENISYSDKKIPLNITSDEPVDLYLKGFRNNVYFERNVTSYESFIYGKEGAYNFTVYATNENGTVSKSIVYNINVPGNPINVTSCGHLSSSGTKYVLANDVESTSTCLFWNFDIDGIDLDLNGFTVKGPKPIYAECSYTKVYNGTLNATGSNYATAIWLEFGSGCLWKDLVIDATGVGISINSVTRDAIFENIGLTAPQGLNTDTYYSSVSVTLINVNFTSPESNPGVFENSAFVHYDSGPSTFTLEEVIVSNYTTDISFPGEGVLQEYILRNVDINTSISAYRLTGPFRIFKQHLLACNVTDSKGDAVPGTVSIVDSGNITRVSEDESKATIVSNPTANVRVGTDSSGLAKAWVTEKLTVYRTASPVTFEEYDFNDYNVTAESKNITNTTSITISGNSTFNLKFTLDAPVVELPECSLAQSLDLDNNGGVNINDGVIILRHITGKPVSTGISKDCKAKSLLPS